MNEEEEEFFKKLMNGEEKEEEFFNKVYNTLKEVTDNFTKGGGVNLSRHYVSPETSVVDIESYLQEKIGKGEVILWAMDHYISYFTPIEKITAEKHWRFSKFRKIISGR